MTPIETDFYRLGRERGMAARADYIARHGEPPEYDPDDEDGSPAFEWRTRADVEAIDAAEAEDPETWAEMLWYEGFDDAYFDHGIAPSTKEIS